MAYNLYNAQMARGWKERIDKENKLAEKFWYEQTLKATGDRPASTGRLPAASGAGAAYAADANFETRSAVSVRSMRSARSAATSVAPSGYTSKTSFLKTKMDMLESELQAERESRKRVEQDLLQLKASLKL